MHAGTAPVVPDDLVVEREGALVTWILNRPQQRNALSVAMREGLARAVADVANDRTVRAVLVRGAGEHFCAGGDVQAMASGEEDTPEKRLARMRSYHPLIVGLAQLDRPVVAAIDGAAFGAGFGLALLADIVLVSSRARLCMAFQRLGLVPDFGATYTLPRVVGLQRAREIFLSAREIHSQEAVQLGIALECVSPDRLHVRAREIAQALSQASPLAVGLTKRALHASFGSSLPDMLEVESSAQAVAATSDYARRAFDTFVRREPSAFRWPSPQGEDPD